MYFIEVEKTLQSLRLYLAQFQCQQIEAKPSNMEAKSYTSSRIPSEFMIMYHSQGSEEALDVANYDDVSSSDPINHDEMRTTIDNQTASVAIVSPSIDIHGSISEETLPNGVNRFEVHGFNTNFEPRNFIPVVSEDRPIDSIVSPSTTKFDRVG